MNYISLGMLYDYVLMRYAALLILAQHSKYCSHLDLASYKTSEKRKSFYNWGIFNKKLDTYSIVF